MKGCKAYPGRVLLLALAMLFVSHPGWPANRPPEGELATFFSQGQAVYSPDNPARSQQEATRDFLVQAITQAVGKYLSPSQMGTQFAPLQENVLKQPEHYVDTYQIFSEAPSGGLYRITGQVTVAVELLRNDLLKLGFALAEKPGQNASMPAGARPGTGPGASASVAVAQGAKESPASLPGGSGSKQPLLWLVSERWSRDWHLPRDRRDQRGLFVMSILQESEDYDWALRFPGSEAPALSESGAVPARQALSLATRLGIEKVVTGTVDMRQAGSQNAVLDVSLHILSASSGKSLGEMRKQWSMGGAPDQQGAMELAATIVPQLDRFLQGPSQAVASSDSQEISTSQDLSASQPASAPQDTSTSLAAKSLGEWTVLIRADHQYVYWEELEKTLRDRFKSMRVRSIELKGRDAAIGLDGVDGQAIASLQGAQLRGGVKVQIGRFAPEAHSIEITFIRPEPVQTGPNP